MMKPRLILLLSILCFPSVLYASPPSDDYKLVWSDEFDDTVLNADKWGYHGLGPRRDAINVKECAALDGKGQLAITTKKVGDEYHTAILETRGKYEFCYGYCETRVKLQTQLGHWSAFWLMPPAFHDGGSPEEFGTEIDIFEYLVKNKNTILFNLHWNGYGKEFHKSTGSKYEMKETQDGYHVVGLQWTPKEYAIFVDGVEAWRTDQAISHVPEYILLSLEVGSWAESIKDATLPDSVYFDYVRVYQLK